MVDKEDQIKNLQVEKDKLEKQFREEKETELGDLLRKKDEQIARLEVEKEELVHENNKKTDKNLLLLEEIDSYKEEISRRTMQCVTMGEDLEGKDQVIEALKESLMRHETENLTISSNLSMLKNQVYYSNRRSYFFPMYRSWKTTNSEESTR